MSELEGRVVLVTGAAGNLGTAVAEAFGTRGARLALLDRSAERLEAVARSLALPPNAMLLPTDLTERRSVDAAVAAVLEQFGVLDVVANIAGGFTMGPPLHETPDEDLEFMLDLNVRSLFNVCRAAVPAMLKGGGGRIVNVSARAAREGKARMGPYCASKAAVITLSETLAAEHRLNGINVNCILPGTIDTPQNRASMPDADHSRWVTPGALADVVVFLASHAARAISGAAIPVYGQS
jgi:NAD(P)-dependent dehydrogenase (short-subunit alcohol dehydrogenase family)